MWRAPKSVRPEAAKLIQLPFVIKSCRINLDEPVTVCNTYVLYRLGTSSVAYISCGSQRFSERALPLGPGDSPGQKSLQQAEKPRGLNRARRMMAPPHLPSRSSWRWGISKKEKRAIQRHRGAIQPGKEQIMVNKQEAGGNVPGTGERLLCLGRSQTVHVGYASSCRAPHQASHVPRVPATLSFSGTCHLLKILFCRILP